jgi:D-alanyl-D-alanine endopeptidase (penicillin-binding protein 7)
MFMRKYIQFYSFILLGVAALIAHLLPFALYGSHPLGYDTGFYRRYLIEPFLSLPNNAVPGLGQGALIPRLLLDIGRLVHIPTDLLLYGSYLSFFFLLPVLIFLYVRQTHTTRSAYIAAILIIFSPVLYHAYWYMLWKNALALCLMIGAFIAIEKRATVPLIILETTLALSHQTSVIIYVATLGVLFCITDGRRIEFALHGIWVTFLFFIVNHSFVHTVSLSLPTAIFLDWRTYIQLSVPLLLILTYCWKAFLGRKVPRTLLAFGIVSFLFPILHLPFYERIFIFCDVALVLFATYSAEYLLAHIDLNSLSWRNSTPLIVLCLFAGLFFGTFWSQVKTLHPLISSDATRTLESINKNLPPDAYLLVSADEAPWFEGWTNAHIAAPGLLHDTHNQEQWEDFWNSTSTEVRTAFIRSFPTPLYVAMLDPSSTPLGSTGIPCLKEISPNLYRSECTLVTKSHSVLLGTHALPLNVRSAGVYDLQGSALWVWNEDVQWPIASVTKIMTAVIANESIPRDKKIEITTAAQKPLRENVAVPTFNIGDILNEHDLVKAMFTVSSNDAAEALAKNYGYDSFIKLMNDRARALGMSNTFFVDASGLSLQNVSTIDDLAKLVRFAWDRDPELFATSRAVTNTVTLYNSATTSSVSLSNINLFAGNKAFLGGKTGGLPEAGENLVSIFMTVSKREPVIVIVLGANDRYETTRSILNELYPNQIEW